MIYLHLITGEIKDIQLHKEIPDECLQVRISSFWTPVDKAVLDIEKRQWVIRRKYISDYRLIPFDLWEQVLAYQTLLNLSQ